MRTLWGHIREDWHQSPLTLLLEIMGTAASMAAAILLSLEVTGLVPVYVLWMVGSVSLTFSSAKRKNINLMMLMLFYTIMNLIGLWTYS